MAWNRRSPWPEFPAAAAPRTTRILLSLPQARLEGIQTTSASEFMKAAEARLAQNAPNGVATVTGPARNAKPPRRIRGSKWPPSRRRPSRRDWRGRGCWRSSSPASFPTISRCTGWRRCLRGRVSRFRGPRKRSGAATWPTSSSRSMNAWPAGCGNRTWWPPTTPRSRCKARGRRGRRACGCTWATKRIRTMCSTSRWTAGAKGRKMFR